MTKMSYDRTSLFAFFGITRTFPCLFYNIFTQKKKEIKEGKQNIVMCITFFKNENGA